VFGRLRQMLFGRTPASPVSAVDVDLMAARARALESLGIDDLLLFLSFDCDTDLDIDRVIPMHRGLTARGIKATYAVPGHQLLKGREAYATVAAEGGEFMNHGARPHAECIDGLWTCVTFYSRMDEGEVREDIRRGDAIVREVIGRAPAGFRAPHFGCFQQPEQLAIVHGEARSLGYRWCSTTIPSYGHERGPLVPVDGVLEIPCTGSARYPTTLLDSWTYLTDRRDYALGDIYAELFIETLEAHRKHGLPGLLVWYADPSHVHGQAPFDAAMDAVERLGVRSVTGSELASMVAA
jgi:peptidoglycan/xylan/chitin deacetylase (PgdA/CDA1 family)